jgi:hypothetical protein
MSFTSVEGFQRPGCEAKTHGAPQRMRRMAIRWLGTTVERTYARQSKPSTNWLTNRRRNTKFNNMVELKEAQLNAVFHALGDITRRQMLRLLANGEHTVGQLAEPFQMSLAAASKHIKVNQLVLQH